MYRPFAFASIFFISGIILGNNLPHPGVCLVLGSISLLAVVISREPKLKRFLLGTLFLLMGAFYYNVYFNYTAGDIVNYAGETMTLVGVVKEPPKVEEHRVSYTVSALELREDEGLRPLTGKIRVTVPREEDGEVYDYKDLVEFTGKIQVPRGKRNPGGFDYRAYLRQQGITATTFSREIQRVGKERSNPFIGHAHLLRRNLIGFFDKNLPPKIASLLSGMLLGNKDGLSKDELRVFADTGLSHVLAVSGLHMAIIYGALEGFLVKVGAHSGVSLILGSVFVVFYSLMAGLSPSVVRAGIAIIVYMLGKAVGRKADPINSLGLAAMVLLMVNPLNIYSISFQLSFGATLGILLFFEKAARNLEVLPNPIKELLAVAISAQLAVFPISAYHFNKISLVGFIVNLLVVPLMGVILVMGFVSGVLGLIFPPLGALLVKIPGVLLMLVDMITSIAHKLPWATALVPSLPLWSYFAYIVILALAFDYIPLATRKPKALAVVLMLLMVFFPLISDSGSLEVTFIDVGQGDSIFIRSPRGRTVIIDAGGLPRYYLGEFDPGEDVVLPFLYSRGIRQIDVAIVSHFDDDHARGLLGILEEIKVGTLVYGHPSDAQVFREMMELAKKRGVETLQVGRGDEIHLDSIVFKVLGPEREAPSAKENDRSVVLKMSYRGLSFLFTGDLEEAGERELINSGLDLSSSVLKLGHHGSNTSTTKEFLSKVAPAFAVVSAGVDNSFGHPSPEVLERLTERGVEVLRTDLQGGITFKIKGKNVNIYTSISQEDNAR